MPYGDRTGPRGQGAMTGRASGFCTGFQKPRKMNCYQGRGGRGLAYGGFGRGCGYSGPGRDRVPSYRGMGFRNVQDPPDYPAHDEMNILKNQADVLKRQLENIEGRIQLLEKAREREE